jgi:hypothetical protein
MIDCLYFLHHFLQKSFPRYVIAENLELLQITCKSGAIRIFYVPYEWLYYPIYYAKLLITGSRACSSSILNPSLTVTVATWTLLADIFSSITLLSIFNDNLIASARVRLEWYDS